MSTYFNTQVGKEIGYDLQFHTEDKEKYEFMQEAARRCIDNKIVFLVDVAPVVHAQWVFDGYKDSKFHKCSACDEFSIREYDSCGYAISEYLTKFCPHCGAIMDEKENEE